MEEKTIWENVKAGSNEAIEFLKKVIREGNVRRIVVKQGARTVAEFPLSVGVVGTVFAPVLAAIGALIALLQDCSIDIERAETPAEKPEEPPPPPQA